jgi:hypothetical protein
MKAALCLLLSLAAAAAPGARAYTAPWNISEVKINPADQSRFPASRPPLWDFRTTAVKTEIKQIGLGWNIKVVHEDLVGVMPEMMTWLFTNLASATAVSPRGRGGEGQSNCGGGWGGACEGWAPPAGAGTCARMHARCARPFRRRQGQPSLAAAGGRHEASRACTAGAGAGRGPPAAGKLARSAATSSSPPPTPHTAPAPPTRRRTL